MARRSRSKSRGVGAAVGGVALIGLALLATVALAAFYYYSPRSRLLDKTSLCPVDGADGINVVLVDATDDLPEIAKRQALQILEDLITGLPAYYKLDIRVLDIEGMCSRSLFAKCNPGDGSGLSEWTSNPRLARMRWIENFRKPARDAVEHSLASAKAKSSPIMAAIQDVAVGEFSSASAEKAKKTLIVLSDMLEFTPYYSQYPRAGDLSYERFRRSPAYLNYRTDLHGAKIRVEYVQRASVSPQFSLAHIKFWQQWVHDNGGSEFAAHRLQGAN